MKKLVFLFAMVFAVSMAMGQNTSDVNQTGNQQEATVGQTGANTSDVIQNNDWTSVSVDPIQKATVTQDGGNTSVVNQQSTSTVSASSSGAEIATVEQKNGNNTSNVNQTSNNQGGIKATVYQDGTRNEVDVDQLQTGGGGNGGNISTSANQQGKDNYLRQYENAPGSNSGQTETGIQDGNRNWGKQEIMSGYTDLFHLQQIGNDNIGEQKMTGAHNTAQIYSTGNSNQAYQLLEGSNFGYSASDVTIRQTGDVNFSDQWFKQGGSSTANEGMVTQDGNRNIGNQYADAKNVQVTITQIGNDNDGQVVYNPKIAVYGKNVQPAYKTYWTQYQESDNSSLSISVTGNSNHTAQVQIGDGPANTENLPKGNLDNNSASIMIMGNNNNSAQNQQGHDLDATIDIFGSNNFAMTQQLGFDNTATIRVGASGANANGNCAGIYQNGSDNSFTLDQMSNNNWSRAIQIGMNATAVVTQQ